MGIRQAGIESGWYDMGIRQAGIESGWYDMESDKLVQESGWYGNQVKVAWNGMEIGWSQYGNQVEVEQGLDKSGMEWDKSKKSDNSWVGVEWCKNSGLTSFLLMSLKQMQSALLRYPSLSNTLIVFE